MIRTADGDEANGPTPSPVPADRIVAADQVCPRFEAAGVETTVVQSAATVGTPYAGATVGGAKTRSYDSLAEGAAKLREAVTEARGPSYTYWYASDLDASTQEYGPDSGTYHDALASITRHLSRELCDRLDRETAAETLLVVTADHGSIPTPPGPRGCLDLREIEAVTANLRRADGGWVPTADEGRSPATTEPRLPPYGDPRVCHLPVEPGAEDSVVAALEARGVTAFVREEVRDLELFGPADAFPDERCGDVIAVPPERKLLYPGMEKVAAFAGTHSGLTARETLVPFAAARLSRLQSRGPTDTKPTHG